MFVRHANIQDMDVLVELGSQLHLVEKQFDSLLNFSALETRERYRNEMVNPNALFLVVEDSKTVVGYLYAHYDEVSYLINKPLECVIEVIYLLQEYRGKGLADTLLEECMQWVADHHIHRVKTGIYLGNVSSQKLFERNGFKPHHTTYMFSM